MQLKLYKKQPKSGGSQPVENNKMFGERRKHES